MRAGFPNNFIEKLDLSFQLAIWVPSKIETDCFEYKRSKLRFVINKVYYYF